MGTHRRFLASGTSVLALVFLAFSGCAGPRTTQPKVNVSELSDEGFQSYLAEVDLVTVDEAFRSILILADGEDTSKTFDERRQKLESRGIVRPQWKLQSDDVVDAGSTAYMICKVCHISGGVDMHLFGSWGLGDRRYALRELIYREMINESVDYQYMTGPAFFALIRKADEVMEKSGLYESKGVDLTDERDRDAQGNLIVPPAPEPNKPPEPNK